jgi:hypothetical protein
MGNIQREKSHDVPVTVSSCVLYICVWCTIWKPLWIVLVWHPANTSWSLGCISTTCWQELCSWWEPSPGASLTYQVSSNQCIVSVSTVTVPHWHNRWVWTSALCLCAEARCLTDMPMKCSQCCGFVNLIWVPHWHTQWAWTNVVSLWV